MYLGAPSGGKTLPRFHPHPPIPRRNLVMSPSTRMALDLQPGLQASACHWTRSCVGGPIQAGDSTPASPTGAPAGRVEPAPGRIVMPTLTG